MPVDSNSRRFSASGPLTDAYIVRQKQAPSLALLIIALPWHAFSVLDINMLRLLMRRTGHLDRQGEPTGQTDRANRQGKPTGRTDTCCVTCHLSKGRVSWVVVIIRRRVSLPSTTISVQARSIVCSCSITGRDGAKSDNRMAPRRELLRVVVRISP
ncbi:hypothetical protein K504DRAFT_5539 [Pleomassaria siparia CBS 279.74]|uniref:Uncharacterized protein n=1 Tax=Pleomassaria siparia CBS 279.74 TaxID=1314801 RepID=A0A6G1KNV4_9PLEO|nr:hypothetical protein K504DRAFT_5539 [Pleomassaria siparia CBS 279.74]